MKTTMTRLMKPLSALLIILLIGACENKPKEKPDEEPEEKPRGKVEKPKETITLERANEMYKAYQERFDVVTEFRGGKEDAKYGWHSLEFYENYIAYLKQASRKAGIKLSGIRMYYVAYPEDDQAGKYSGYQTYIYVPTYYNEKYGEHLAFDPLHIGDDGVPLPIHDIIVNGKTRTANSKSANAEDSNEDSMSRVAGGTESSLANMGEMCEPNCPTNEKVTDSN